MSRGFSDNFLVQLLFWIAVSAVGLAMFWILSCRFGMGLVGC